MKATEEEIERFGKIMAILKVSLPTNAKLTPDEEAIRSEVFWEALKEYSIEQVERGAYRALKELRYFPSPVELIDCCREEANRMYLERLPRNVPLLEERKMTHEEAKAALDNIFRRVGVYPSMSTQEIEDDKERVAKRKAFLKQQAESLN